MEPERFIGQYYGLRVESSELAAYQDRNYLITERSGRRYILKITSREEDFDFVRSQNRLLEFLAGTDIGNLIPSPVRNLDGHCITEITDESGKLQARLFHYLEGSFLAESDPGTAFFNKLGKAFGRLDRLMEGYHDPELKARSHEWDLTGAAAFEDDLHLIEDIEVRRLVAFFLMKYREEVLPVLHRLPRSLIHSDGNDWNILVKDGVETPGADMEVSGILDFGDMVFAPRINEPAILLAYALMGRKDFRGIYRAVVDGFLEEVNLESRELDLLYYLVAARWCQTLVMAARQERINPGSSYHQVSVAGARAMLNCWIRENPVNYLASRHFQGIPEEPAGAGSGRRYRYFSTAVSLSYREPITMAGSALQYMYSSDGKTYLDCVNNIPHVGHCHPKVVAAGQRQMAKLNTNTRYLYESLDRYAERLLAKFPPSLNRLFLVNSGSAATDLAVRLAEAHTGNCSYLVLDYAYHGNTKSAIGLSPYKFNRKGGRGKPDRVTILRPDGTEAHIPQGGPHTFFAESIVGCAGQIMLSAPFLQQVTGEVRKQGGLFVADEVQTGFGRSGQCFWAFELYGVVPDIVILGKPIANGHPMGAVVCTEEVARSFETGMEFFSSFGGNPVSCEIGLAVLEVIEEEGLQEHARQVGDYLLSELRDRFITGASRPGPDGSGGYQGPYGRVREVRGSGLFLGIELIDPATGGPATEAATGLVNRMKEKGFLLSTDGPFNNVIKFKPPMCFSMDNARELVEALEGCAEVV